MCHVTMGRKVDKIFYINTFKRHVKTFLFKQSWRPRLLAPPIQFAAVIVGLHRFLYIIIIIIMYISVCVL